MSERRIEEYIEGKYGRWGLDRWDVRKFLLLLIVRCFRTVASVYWIEGNVFHLFSRVWHDTAVPFTKVLEDFEGWLEDHGLWNATRQGKMVGAAFVTW